MKNETTITLSSVADPEPTWEIVKFDVKTQTLTIGLGIWRLWQFWVGAGVSFAVGVLVGWWM